MKNLYYSLIAIVFIISLLGSCTPVNVPTSSRRQLRIIDNKLMGILPLREGKVTYSFTMPMEGITDVDLFRQTRRWVAFHVKDPKAAFQVGDFATKDVIGTGALNAQVLKNGAYSHYMPAVDYTVTIECYSGFIRTTFSNFLWRSSSVVPYKGITEFGEPIEGGANSKYEEDVILEFKEINQSILDLAQSLQGFVIENVKAQPPTDK